MKRWNRKWPQKCQIKFPHGDGGVVCSVVEYDDGHHRVYTICPASGEVIGLDAKAFRRGKVQIWQRLEIRRAN